MNRRTSVGAAAAGILAAAAFLGGAAYADSGPTVVSGASPVYLVTVEQDVSVATFYVACNSGDSVISGYFTANGNRYGTTVTAGGTVRVNPSDFGYSIGSDDNYIGYAVCFHPAGN